MTRGARIAEFDARYAARMGEFAASQTVNSASDDAFPLGREAIDIGVGILQLTEIHGRALVAAVALGSAENVQSISERASSFLTESLAPFEMVNRGFLETVSEVENLNLRLNKKIDKLEQLAAIVAASDDAIIAATLDGTILTWSPGAERLYGYTAAEMIGTIGISLVPDELQSERVQLIDDLAENRSLSSFETIRIRKDGKPVHVSLTVSPIRNEEGVVTAMAVVGRDIGMRAEAEEERLRLEGQLRQMQKSEAIGSLAGGIAHDFNNFLTVIRGYAGVLRPMLHDEKAKQPLEQIDRAAEQAALLTGQLLAFSRQQVLRPEVSNLNDVVEETLALLDRVLGEDIEIERHLDPELARIFADRGQLAQVVLNLAVNARDAMPDGGTLVIRSENRFLDDVYVATRSEISPGRYVILEITDSGAGMDEETRDRVFDPFFTTKPTGTGLGLSTVYGIVRQSGGYIWVYSELRVGTTFKLYFPTTDEQVAPAVDAMTSGSLDGNETILLIEDNEMLRPLVADVLESFGYSVVRAASGPEALALARATPAPAIDLVLTDVVMPGMNGREVAEILGGEYPGLRVLFTSGYPSDSVIRERIAEGRAGFIQKPFLADELARAIRKTLEGANHTD